jgi:L-asparaginase
MKYQFLTTNEFRFFSSYVGAEQARIMLQLAIGAGYSLDGIRGLFETPLRDTIYAPDVNQKSYYAP